MKLAYSIFMLTDSLSCGLQRSALSCTDGSEMVKGVIQKLAELRSQDSFNSFYQDVMETGNILGKLIEFVVGGNLTLI